MVVYGHWVYFDEQHLILLHIEAVQPELILDKVVDLVIILLCRLTEQHR